MNALTADFFRMSGGCVGFAEGRRLRCDRPTGARISVVQSQGKRKERRWQRDQQDPR